MYRNDISRLLNEVLSKFIQMDVICTYEDNMYYITIPDFNQQLKSYSNRQMIDGYTSIENLFSFMSLRYNTIEDSVPHNKSIILTCKDIRIKKLIKDLNKILSILSIGFLYHMMAPGMHWMETETKIYKEYLKGDIHPVNKEATMNLKRIFPNITIKGYKWYIYKKDLKSLFNNYKNSMVLAELSKHLIG